MIQDLQLATQQEIICQTQVCVVGGGTAGIFLAHQLRKKGIQVVLLEAGDSTARTPENIDRYCEQRGIRYRGAESGRSFGLGGTSVLWGGQMLPLVRSDISERPEAGFTAWPINYDELASYFPQVGAGLGVSFSDSSVEPLPEIRDQSPALQGLADFDLRWSVWLPFKRRNFAQAFRTSLANDSDLTVWTNAEVVSMEHASNGGVTNITRITARSSNGRVLHVESQLFVICAGALESTRLLLAFDETSGGSITNNGAPLGRYFADHLSVVCGRFLPLDRRGFNLAVAPRFESGLMRTPRLELAPSAQRQHRLSSAFAHFAFITSGSSGFDVVRNLLRRRQGKDEHLGLTPTLLGKAARDISAIAFWRLVHRRLWFPADADLLLQVDIEQMPNQDSRLFLSDDSKDALGRKRLVIDWRIKPEDLSVIRHVADLAEKAWRVSPLSRLADLQLSLPATFDSFESLYDVYHPTGALRMGSSASNSVVDKNLRLWAVANCFVSTTAVFPSAGSANPGMTHLALTARLAEHLGKRLRGAI